MKHMGKLSSWRITTKQIIITTIIVLILSAIAYWLWPYLALIGDADKTRESIAAAGAFGPLVYMGLQVAQIIIAPIPGQIIGLAGGYLFGPELGLLYTVVGATIGFTLVFVLTRKLGRPFVERFVSKSVLAKFDDFASSKGPLTFFLIFLLPAFPDDIISFVAGLTKIKIRTLILVSVLGRLPGYVVLAFAGNGLTNENMNPIVVTGFAMLLLFGAAVWKRKWLHEFVAHDNKVAFIRQQWNGSWGLVAMWAVGIIVLSVVLYAAASVTPIQQ